MLFFLLWLLFPCSKRCWGNRARELGKALCVRNVLAAGYRQNVGQSLTTGELAASTDLCLIRLLGSSHVEWQSEETLPVSNLCTLLSLSVSSHMFGILRQ